MGNFSIALSGLMAQSQALNVVSNNLANLNTAGFKGSSASFQDLVTQAMSSTTPNGAGVSSVMAQKSFTQGSVQVTSGAFDAAIEGNGFFVVQNSLGQQLYTRAGNFRLDASGNLVTANGEFVLGWTAANGTVNPSGVPVKITVPAGSTVKPAPTTGFTLDANLNASALTTGPTSTFSAPVTVVDSLGATHNLNVTFTKTASNSWKYEVFVPGEDVTGGTAGTPKSLTTGTLTFDNKGQLTTPAAGAPVAIDLTGLANGAADLSVNWNLYNPDNTSALTQYAQSSATSGTTVDGNAAAELSMVSVGDGGTILAQFANGKTQAIAQIALASIPNPDSLISVGENDYALGSQTASPTIGAAGSGGRGQIKAGALESSNVDIATEFTHLMTYQRSYEANSRTITTIDQMIQTLMQMKP